MKVAVLGAGKMGAAAATFLARDTRTSEIVVFDRDPDALATAAGAHEAIDTHEIDLMEASLTPVLEPFDVALFALANRMLDYRVLEEAIVAGTDVIDILEEYQRYPSDDVTPPAEFTREEYGQWLHEQAVDAGVTFVSGCGLAPGLTNIAVGRGIRLLDTATSATSRVGGLPEHVVAEQNPLGYAATWSLDHVWREYVAPAEVVRDGELAIVDSLSGYETFTFDAFGKHTELECFITPGMPSIPHTCDLEAFEERTIRWPGHHRQVTTLRDIGLLSDEPVAIDGVEVSPRSFLTRLVEDKLRLREEERDLTVLWNSVEGERAGEPTRVNHFMWEYANEEHSAMARTTAGPAAMLAMYLAKASGVDAGILAAEEFVDDTRYEQLLGDLAEQLDIHIEETIEQIEAPTATSR